ncbi:hypothetical protein F4778DRAFT_786655 [Xylariomycetidae sp. FL2044]|nr:hypothetical protein F4778DRAFT_786655 [Xylariomycetidae sp. FL2044]
MSSYYQTSFLGLVALCAGLLVSQPTRRHALNQKGAQRKQVSRDDRHPEKEWYKAYGLVMAADWLQGPWLYSLYRDEHGLSAGRVSSLFITGFLSSAVSGYYVGSLSDRYGRKLACMVFCLLYGVSCCLTVVPVAPLLFLGRVLGGVSTSILFSVFDSWMVTNFRDRRLVDDGCDLSRTYAATGTVNSLAAILSGVVGQALVKVTGSKKAPFILSTLLLWSALQVIWSHWIENYGSREEEEKEEEKSTTTNEKEKEKEKVAAQPPISLWSVLKQPSILALTFASAMFEGSMYLFVFMWTPTLQSLHQRSSSSSSSSEDELPYGFIFSCFMASSMAAALAFNIVMQRRLVRYWRLLVGVMLLANFCFVQLAGPRVRTEDAAFWLFCLFEACVGAYWPCTGYLKGRLVPDAARARVYGVMRVPLNLFVVACLVFVAQDQPGNASRVFSACSVLLTASFGAVWAARASLCVPDEHEVAKPEIPRGAQPLRVDVDHGQRGAALPRLHDEAARRGPHLFGRVVPTTSTRSTGSSPPSSCSFSIHARIPSSMRASSSSPNRTTAGAQQQLACRTAGRPAGARTPGFALNLPGRESRSGMGLEATPAVSTSTEARRQRRTQRVRDGVAPGRCTGTRHSSWQPGVEEISTRAGRAVATVGVPLVGDRPATRTRYPPIRRASRASARASWPAVGVVEQPRPGPGQVSKLEGRRATGRRPVKVGSPRGHRQPRAAEGEDPPGGEELGVGLGQRGAAWF